MNGFYFKTLQNTHKLYSKNFYVNLVIIVVYQLQREYFGGYGNSVVFLLIKRL